jgi:hypothetical protein
VPVAFAGCSLTSQQKQSLLLLSVLSALRFILSVLGRISGTKTRFALALALCKTNFEFDDGCQNVFSGMLKMM